MWLELTTGKDSFRQQGSSPRRNVSVQIFTRVADDGEGRKIVPMFAAYQKKLRGFQNTNLIQTIPATASYGPEIAGCWFNNRNELLSGTEILVEYRYRTAGGGFGESVEHLMLIANETAPLWQTRLDLPRHHLSAVPSIFFVGRYDIVDKDDLLTPEAIAIWRDYLSLDEDYHLSDILDPAQDEEDRVFLHTQLEARIKAASRIDRTTRSDDGKSRIKIRRSRRVKTR